MIDNKNPYKVMNPCSGKTPRQLIEDCVDARDHDPENKFNDWELEFIESMEERLKYHEIKLTEKQKQHLEKIWEKI